MNNPYHYRKLNGDSEWAVVTGDTVIRKEKSRKQADLLTQLLNLTFKRGRASVTNPDLDAERADAYRKGYIEGSIRVHAGDELEEAAA